MGDGLSCINMSTCCFPLNYLKCSYSCMTVHVLHVDMYFRGCYLVNSWKVVNGILSLFVSYMCILIVGVWGLLLCCFSILE